MSTVTSRDELIRLITEMERVEWTLHYAFGEYKQRKNLSLTWMQTNNFLRIAGVNLAT